MKPRIDKVVYVVYSEIIMKVKVAFLGKYAFITDRFGLGEDEDTLEYLYEDFGKTWFNTFTQAQKYLIDELKQEERGCRFVEVEENVWVALSSGLNDTPEFS